MNGHLISTFQEWFDAYVSSFSSSDPQLRANLELKAAHTRRVCEGIARIAASLGLKRMDYDLAFSAALFHDVGRFPQLQRYGTFNDRCSEDHAALGLKILADSAVLKILDEKDRNTLCKAIQFHNKYEIPDDDHQDFLLTCRLLRDADKLDILGLITSHLENRKETPNQALDFGFKDSPGISEELLSDISSCKMARIGVMRNLNDMKLMYLSWVFDINFPITLSLIMERRYLDKLLRGLPEDAGTREIKHLLDSYIREKRRISI